MALGRRRTRSEYCPSCGTRLESSANFCPSCGRRTAGGPAFEPRSYDRREGVDGGDRAVLEDRVTEAIEEGWTVERDAGDRVVVVRRTLGSPGKHLVVALATFWWTMGVGNALFAAYCYLASADRCVLRADDATRRSRDRSSLSALTAVAILWLVAGLFVAMATVVPSTPVGVGFVGVAVLFAAVGTSRFPSVRRRLENRRSFSVNGRTRTVDERVVFAPSEPCASCAGPIRRGVERTYLERYSILGVPLFSDVSGRNAYCRSCADGRVRRGTGEADRPSAAVGERTRSGRRERRQRRSPIR